MRSGGYYFRAATRLVRVGPLIRRFAGTPLGFDSDFDSLEAIQQAWFAHGCGFVSICESRGVARRTRAVHLEVGTVGGKPHNIVCWVVAYRMLLGDQYVASEYIGYVLFGNVLLFGPIVGAVSAILGAKLRRPAGGASQGRVTAD